MTAAVISPVVVDVVRVEETAPISVEHPINSRGTVLSWSGVALGLLATGGDQVGMVHVPLMVAALVLSALGICRWWRGGLRWDA
ncbi:hypothetical protein [Deinococcus gobiensis]|uniref:hypothetical protein n=1 Tax=Deinococcus gobiensis TaxID=502394 RepID=UPI0011AE2752|nr:hypothetical protein [Deinococcus gobiensis]